jgi:sugar O-acyltransferase (sialic acid O-acetyltransferase NeuD family)
MNSLNNFTKQLICWGGGDQSIVLKPIIERLGSQYDIVIDDTVGALSPFNNVELLQGKIGFEKWLKGRDVSQIGFIIAIGNPYGHVRCALHDYLVDKGLTPVTICDPSALLDDDVHLESGIQIMKGAVINAKSHIGRQCIINTRSIIEHHCRLGEGVEIGPGAVLCGRVDVSQHSWVGAGATILPRLKVGENCIVGAGAVVTASTSNDAIFTGVPARFLKNNSHK